MSRRRAAEILRGWSSQACGAPHPPTAERTGFAHLRPAAGNPLRTNSQPGAPPSRADRRQNQAGLAVDRRREAACYFGYSCESGSRRLVWGAGSRQGRHRECAPRRV